MIARVDRRPTQRVPGSFWDIVWEKRRNTTTFGVLTGLLVNDLCETVAYAHKTINQFSSVAAGPQPAQNRGYTITQLLAMECEALTFHPRSSHFPISYLPFSPFLRGRSLNPTAGGLEERCKLPQQGLGRSPSRNWIWCILALKSDISFTLESNYQILRFEGKIWHLVRAFTNSQKCGPGRIWGVVVPLV